MRTITKKDRERLRLAIPFQPHLALKAFLKLRTAKKFFFLIFIPYYFTQPHIDY